MPPPWHAGSTWSDLIIVPTRRIQPTTAPMRSATKSPGLSAAIATAQLASDCPVSASIAASGTMPR